MSSHRFRILVLSLTLMVALLHPVYISEIHASQTTALQHLSNPDIVEILADSTSKDVSFYQKHRPVILSLIGTSILVTFSLLLIGIVMLRHKNRIIARHTEALEAKTIALEKVQESLTKAQEIAKLGNWDWDIATNRLYWSAGIYTIFQLDPDKVEPDYDLFISKVLPEDREKVELAVKDALDQIEPYNIHHRILLSDGTVRIIHEQGEVVFDDQGNPIRMIGTVQDVTEQKEAEYELERLTKFDALTNLPNRRYLFSCLTSSMSRCDRSNQLLALLVLDLDNFKAINDTLGHKTGDQLLVEVAQRLQKNVRKGDTLVRMGGDEFVVVLENIDSPINVARACEKLICLFKERFHVNEQEIFTSPSIGISLYPSDGSDVQTLIKHADTAMYQSKEAGKNSFRFFTQEMNTQALSRMIIGNKLRHAIEKSELSLNFQPQIDTRSGVMTSAEALLRWNNPELGFVSPADFIPIAEESGLILSIGEWVIDAVFKQLESWIDDGVEPVRIAINISSRQVSQNTLHKSLAEQLERHSIDTSLIELELTEGTVMDSAEKTLQQLEKVREMGIRIAIDDFGTGYSSLSYLKKLPIDKLKIDRSFIQDIEIDDDDLTLTRAIINIATSLQLDIIAEGVENSLQNEILQQEGCYSVQGYYFSRPLNVEDFTRILREKQHFTG